MVYRRERGLNFLQTRYKLLDKTTFVPHLRSNHRASIPYSILDSFNNKKPEVAFIKIYNSGKIFSFRIKKLYHEGNSYTISLKNERKLRNIKIKILNIKSEADLLDRGTSDFLKFIPQFTNKSTPIYIFNHNQSYFVGGYYKKDIFINKELLQDKLLRSFLGLYLAEGGKTAATFTNSWPEAVNLVLDFIESNCGVNRKEIRASICCNSVLKSKKKELERFWTEKTGICNFFTSLHINKNIKSPQGVLDLKLNSEVLKELFLNLIQNLNFSNDKDFMNGFLSGDGCPILQNRYFITHHIVFDPKRSIFNRTQYKDLFVNYKSNFINDNRLVIYTNWKQNLYWLVNGFYSLSPMKRFKFIKYFLSLPKTKTCNDSEKEALFNEYKKTKSYLEDFYKSLVNYGIRSKEHMEEFILEELE